MVAAVIEAGKLPCKRLGEMVAVVTLPFKLAGHNSLLLAVLIWLQEMQMIPKAAQSRFRRVPELRVVTCNYVQAALHCLADLFLF